MVQKTFGIYGDGSDMTRLFVEVGTQHLACWTLTLNGKLHSFEFFLLDEQTRTHFREAYRQSRLHSRILEQSFQQAAVVMENECCLTMPVSELGEELQRQLLYQAFGEEFGYDPVITTLTDKQCLFGVPGSVRQVFQQEFNATVLTHKFASLAQRPSSGAYHAVLTCYPQSVLLRLCREGNLVLVQRFGYHTPEDVAYHVLNACRQVNIPLNDLLVEVEGFIETESQLYGELYKYIPRLELVQVAKDRVAAAGFYDFPLHYFSSFLKPLP